MKQGKLIRRAVSVALAGCMMFTLSAPALAASTDDLLQQSTAAKSAVSVLDAENGDTVDYGITITIYGKGKVKVDSSNCNNILGFLKYDPDKEKLTLLNPNASAVNYLTIDAPDTDVVLEYRSNPRIFVLSISTLETPRFCRSSIRTLCLPPAIFACCC